LKGASMDKTGVSLRLPPLLHVLHYLSSRSGRSYCWPSQAKILDLLERYQGVKICRRTLNYWLKEAEDAGFIRRVRRISRTSTGVPDFQTTLYELKKKARCWARRVAGWLGVKTPGQRVHKKPYEPPPRWAVNRGPLPAGIGPPVVTDPAEARAKFAALAGLLS